MPESSDMFETLTTYKDLFLVLHLLGFAIGAGAATVHDSLLAQYLRQFDEQPWPTAVFSLCSSLVNTALVWTAISGTALLLLQLSLFSNPLFQLKLIILGVIALNQLLLQRPMLQRLRDSFLLENPNIWQQRHTKRIRQLGFSLGAVSLSSWYSVIGLTGLQSLQLPLWQLIALYLIVLGFSVGISLWLEQRFSQRLEQRAKEVMRDVAATLLNDYREDRVKANQGA